MNNKIVRHASDDHSVVKLAIYDDSGSTRVDVASDDGGAVVWIDDDVLHASTSLSFKIGLDQSTLSGLSDIQFVIDSTPFHVSPSSPKPAPAPKVPTTNTPTERKLNKTSFTGVSTGGGIMCGGKRAHARGKKANVTFTLVTNKIKDEDNNNLAEIWGGWSQSHGAVTLTPRIIFKRNDLAKSDAPDHKGEEL